MQTTAPQNVHWSTILAAILTTVMALTAFSWIASKVFAGPFLSG